MKRNRTANLVRLLDRALLFIATIGLVSMMLHVSLDILSSLILNAPIAITSAIVTNYYMIAVAFVPIVAAEYRGNHISVNLATERLPVRLRRMLETLALAVTAGVYGLLTAQSWQQALEKLSISAYVIEQTSKIYVWPSFFILPAAFGAMTLLLSLKVYMRLTGGKDASLQSGFESGISVQEADHV